MGIPRRSREAEPITPIGEFAFRDARWEKRYPNLWEFVSRVLWPAGEGGSPPESAPRVPGVLIVFVDEGGLLKGCLSDKDTGMVAFVAADGLEGILDALERGLAKDSLDWRPSRESAAARKRKA